MIDLTRHPRLLRWLSYVDRIRALFRRKHHGQHEADQQLAAFYKRIWREAATELGAAIVDLGNDVLEIRLGEHWTRVWQNYSAIDNLATHRVVRTKPVMYRLLGAAGLPVPSHVNFTLGDMKSAVTFLDSKKSDCVIKPASGTGGGLAVTTGIRTRWQLARATWAACIWGEQAVIEEQVAGHNYRLLYLDGELLDVVKREPPAVVADGASSVMQMVRRVNRERLGTQGAVSHAQLSLDMDMRTTLRRQGLSFRSIPRPGTVVQLKTAINENSSQENVTATDELCPEIIGEGAKAAQISGLRLAGVDIITTNPAVALGDSGGVILEVNSPPGYFWHYHKRDGAFPLALYVLRALFDLKDAPAANRVRTIFQTSTTNGVIPNGQD